MVYKPPTVSTQHTTMLRKVMMHLKRSSKEQPCKQYVACISSRKRDMLARSAVNCHHECFPCWGYSAQRLLPVYA
eukprot:1138506-Pelagomonas_calceolata.AAC.20